MLSRVADSLYWMSRYVERAENIARILDVNLQLMLDLPKLGPEEEKKISRTTLPARIPLFPLCQADAACLHQVYRT